METEGTAQRLTDNQEYLPVHQGPLPRTFEELATPQHALYASEHLSQKESSRCSTGVVYLPRPFEGAPEGIREKKPPILSSSRSKSASILAKQRECGVLPHLLSQSDTPFCATETRAFLVTQRGPIGPDLTRHGILHCAERVDLRMKCATRFVNLLPERHRLRRVDPLLRICRTEFKAQKL